jgi:hypothetical protein
MASTETSDAAQGTPPAAPTPVAKERDWWDRAEIIGKLVTGLLPAILVGAIGLFGQQFTQSLENNRLYTELLTRREQADTDLRKDMFSVLMREFLAGASPLPGGAVKAVTAAPEPESIELPAERIRAEIKGFADQLLKIQILALNFSESLTLSPLFQRLDADLFHIETRIKDDVTGALQLKLKTLVGGLRKRLVGLATRVSSSQIAAIKAVGTAFTIYVQVSDAAQEYVWPFDDPVYSVDSSPQESRTTRFRHPLNRRRPAKLENALPLGDVSCGRVLRRFQIQFSSPDLDRKQVRISLNVHKIAELANDRQVSAAALDPEQQTVEKKFSLDHFNFPLVDNTRLSDDQRFSLVLTKFDKNAIEVTALCFSGTHSSVRDRPYVNDIVETLSQ